MKIGEYNLLVLNRMVDFGAYLVDEDAHEVLLPNRYLTAGMQVGDELRVFVYNDSENRPVATTEHPYAVVGEFALMRVKAVNAVGAFLDWGLSAKDLLVPFGEQRVTMQQGRSYIVRLYIDNVTGRIAASAKLGKFLGLSTPDYYHRQRVDLLVVQQTEMGYRVIVDNAHRGIIYHNEIYSDVNVGDRLTGFVKLVRPDGKIDVTLEKIEKMRVDDLSVRILDYLRSHGGAMPLGDKSDPKEIMRVLRCSKKDFKKALGQLYKQHLVSLQPEATTLLQNK